MNVTMPVGVPAVVEVTVAESEALAPYTIVLGAATVVDDVAFATVTMSPAHVDPEKFVSPL